MMRFDQSLVGATIAGKYRISRVMGTGAMGVVCEARHVELGKRVAIKLIESSLASNEEAARRFRREARAASAIESDHIVQVFDAGVDPEHGLFMVMELLEGEDLEARLHRERRIDVESATRIAIQIARALAKAQAKGVVHRDLKPANVFLVAKDDGSVLVKVLDFGISLMTGPDLSKTGAMKLTQAGIAVGSPQYSSPEQVQGLPDVDHRSDVWSLGIVLYEMVAGRTAYDEKPTYEEFALHLIQNEPEPLTKVAPWVPPALAAIVHAAVRHNVDERIPDCGTFARLLAQAVPGAAVDSGAQRLRAAPAPTWRKAKAADADETILASSAPSFDEEPPPPSGTLVMTSPPEDLDVVLDTLPPIAPPDSDNFPTRPRALAPSVPTPANDAAPPAALAVSRRPQPVPNQGGIMLMPRAMMPTMPSFARQEEALKRKRLRTVLIVILAALVLVAGALVAWKHFS